MAEPSQIKVWDPLVRFFHWALVGAFALTYITEDDFLTLHSWAGYFIIALLCIRVVWGFVGTRYARFSDFLYAPKKIIQFLKDTLDFSAKRYLGHNPAGGAMVMILILTLFATSFSGVILLGAEEHTGPLAHWFSQQGDLWADILEEVHELLANLTLLLVFIHVAGVFVESYIHKENLVSAMITGFKMNK